MTILRLKLPLSVMGKDINQKVLITRLRSSPQDTKEGMDTGEQKVTLKIFHGYINNHNTLLDDCWTSRCLHIFWLFKMKYRKKDDQSTRFDLCFYL